MTGFNSVARVSARDNAVVSNPIRGTLFSGVCGGEGQARCVGLGREIIRCSRSWSTPPDDYSQDKHIYTHSELQIKSSFTFD